MVMELIEESESEKFNEISEVIFQLAPELIDLHKVTMLREMFSQKARWSSVFTPPTFACGAHTMNRALKIAKLLNSKLYGRCNMLEMFKLFEDLELSKHQVEVRQAASIKQCDS